MKREFALVDVLHGEPILCHSEVHFPIESSGCITLVEIHLNDELINVIRIKPTHIYVKPGDVLKLYIPDFGQSAEALDIDFVIR